MKPKPKKPVKQVFNKLNKKLALHHKHVKVHVMNGDNPNDRLELLKTKCEQEIQAKEQELAVLKAKRRNLVEFGEEAEKLKVPEAAQDKYAHWGMTDAVLDAIDALWRTGKGTSEGVTASQIRDYVIAHGFTLQANPHNFSIAVNVTLKRLADSRRILSVMGYSKVDSGGLVVAGKMFYQPIKRPTGSSLRFRKGLRKKIKIFGRGAGKTGSVNTT
jgi:hypothetical protein